MASRSIPRGVPSKRRSVPSLRMPHALRDYDADEETRERVDRRPGGQPDDDVGNGDAERRGGIADHVKIIRQTFRDVKQARAF